MNDISHACLWKDELLEALKQRPPYNAPAYSNHFRTIDALAALRDFCYKSPDIEGFYAMGSVAHGLLVDGSDIDHPCIKTKRPLSYDEKVHLIDQLEPLLLDTAGVSKLCCIRKYDYTRVFYDWEELKSTPKADIRIFELYPSLEVMTLDKLDPIIWMNTLLQTASGLPSEGPRPKWIQKMGDRIASCFDTDFTYFPNAANGNRFVFSPKTKALSLGYNVENEYINITDYSPFCHVNEVSEAYREKPFVMPFYAFPRGDVRPVHPDTFVDLGLDPSRVDHYLLVHPTSSFRTVYDPRENVCYKLPLMRTITRGIRDLPDIALQRAEYAAKELTKHPCKDFSFLPEEVHYADDPRHNYIKRYMPNTRTVPWFSEIASQRSSTAFQMACMQNIIKTWMFFASHDIFLEYHTQNILVDSNANIYFRDLSDVMIHDGGVSDRDWCKGTDEALAISFDRAVCNQNLDHAFRYNGKLGAKERNALEFLIQAEIKRYKLTFPKDYSLSFSPNDPARVPVKTPLVRWRFCSAAHP